MDLYWPRCGVYTRFFTTHIQAKRFIMLLISITKKLETLLVTWLLIQILQTWHLLCIVGVICCVGVLLILAKTIAQAITTPELVSDSEHPTGTTVRIVILVGAANFMARAASGPRDRIWPSLDSITTYYDDTRACMLAQRIIIHGRRVYVDDNCPLPWISVY